MKIKKMWKEMVSLALVATIILATMVPAAARGPVKDENTWLVVRTSWGYNAPKKGARKIKRFKAGTLVKVKLRCRTATFKPKRGKKVSGYIDAEPAYGSIYGLKLRKSPDPKSKALVKKMTKKKGKAEVTGWWLRCTYKGKTYWCKDEFNIESGFNPFDGKYYFFVRECGGDNTGTAGSSFRYFIKDYWRDEYCVSPWGYTLLKRAK